MLRFICHVTVGRLMGDHPRRPVFACTRQDGAVTNGPDQPEPAGDDGRPRPVTIPHLLRVAGKVNGGGRWPPRWSAWERCRNSFSMTSGCSPVCLPDPAANRATSRSAVPGRLRPGTRAGRRAGTCRCRPGRCTRGAGSGPPATGTSGSVWPVRRAAELIRPTPRRSRLYGASEWSRLAERQGGHHHGSRASAPSSQARVAVA